MIKDKEAFQRLNFLYQAAHCVLAQNPDNQELARFYCQTQNNISRRLVLRQREIGVHETTINRSKGPFREKDHLQILLLSSCSWNQLNCSPTKAPSSAVDCCAVPELWLEQAFPQ